MRPTISHEDSTYYLLDPLEDFAEGAGRRYEINGKDLAAFLFAGRVIVVDNECPHAGASLCKGTIDAQNITCPNHGWKFGTDDGSAGSDQTLPIHWYPTVILDKMVWVSLTPKQI